MVVRVQTVMLNQRSHHQTVLGDLADKGQAAGALNRGPIPSWMLSPLAIRFLLDNPLLCPPQTGGYVCFDPLTWPS